MVSIADRLFTLKLQAYRSFRDETSIDIRPLTLLYGFNQAGKSTLVRLLALLADSLAPGAGPLDLRSPAARGATFKELGHLGREPNLTSDSSYNGTMSVKARRRQSASGSNRPRTVSHGPTASTA
ncbi:AAA family ATPase [Lamprocystis purpurea]|jgi:predicted ATPase|uniref:AAA family ATPase n=1 Tax=Lamprocystis purpurea TaxID=61598 RepID=UPI00036ECD1B|nr:ATP-binding protein [Lamprocystis purpurea]